MNVLLEVNTGDHRDQGGREQSQSGGLAQRREYQRTTLSVVVMKA